MICFWFISLQSLVLPFPSWPGQEAAHVNPFRAQLTKSFQELWVKNQGEPEGTWGLAKDQTVTDLGHWTLWVSGTAWETEQWNFHFLLLFSALAEKVMLYQLVMEFNWCLSTRHKDIMGFFYSVGQKLPPVWPLCAKPLLHHQKKSRVLNVTAANRKSREFIPFIAPCITLLLQWISG